MYDKDPVLAILTAIGGWIILWLIISIIIHILVSIKFGEIAEIKGYSRNYGCWVFFTGIIGIIMVAVLPDREASVNVTNTVRVRSEETQKAHIHRPERNADLPEI